MTSRVQKGGPIFRPTVTKSRTRPPVGNNRRPSNFADNPNDSRHEETPAVTQSLMPPPLFISQMLEAPVSHSTSGFDKATTQQALANLCAANLSQNSPQTLAPSLFSGRPPTLVVTNSQVVPPFVPNEKGSSLVVDRAPPSLITSAFASSLPPLPTPDFVENVPESSTSSIHSHHPVAENAPRPSSNNTKVVAKPRRTAVKKKALDIASASGPLEGSSYGQEEPAKKSVKRKRTTKGSDSDLNKTQSTRIKSAVAASGPGGNGNETTNTVTNKRTRRSSSGTPRPRRSRASSILPFDPDADPGEEIDPTIVTMASLCVDTGQGRVSRKAAEILSNHAAWKAQNREKRARLKALMELKKYGREEDELDDTASKANPVDKGAQESLMSEPSTGVALVESAPVVDDTGSGFDYSQDMVTSRFNVQVRIGPNGETIIDEESLVVDRTEPDDTENYTHIVESDHTKFVNSGSYGKKFRGSRWSAEETESFYDALSQYGENYELIAYVLPGRDRKSCKNKFKAEDKKNPARINYCLSNSIPVDMNTLSRMTGKDFSGPVPEIRAPTVQIEIDPTPAEIGETTTPEVDQKKRRVKKKAVNDDGVVVVGDAEDFIPFPESP